MLFGILGHVSRESKSTGPETCPQVEKAVEISAKEFVAHLNSDEGDCGNLGCYRLVGDHYRSA
jgi:hypothetical protein